MSLGRGLSDPACQNVQIKIQPAINDFYSSAHMNTIFLVIFQTTGPRARGQSFYLQGSDKRRGAGPVIFWLNRQIGSRDTDEDTVQDTSVVCLLSFVVALCFVCSSIWCLCFCQISWDRCRAQSLSLVLLSISFFGLDVVDLL